MNLSVHLFFKKLIGIETDPDKVGNAFYKYSEYTEVDDDEYHREKLNPKKLKKKFDERFKIILADVESFFITPREYCFIVCSQVLHFFPESKKLELIEKFHQSLQSGGLMFLRMAHCNDPFNKTLIEKEHCIFEAPSKEGKGPPIPRYTIEPEKFIQKLASYNILNQYTQTTERSYFFVIKKG